MGPTYQHRYGKAPAYAYLFARGQPYAPGISFSDHDPATVGAYHTGDVPYWLRTRDALNLFRQTRVWEDADVTLETEMSGALLSFARTGKPFSPTVGKWPLASMSQSLLVWLGEGSRIGTWPNFKNMPLFGVTKNEPRTQRRVRD